MDAYLFDVDGVITDPIKREITKPEIVMQLVNKLNEGDTVGLISGRGLLWLRSRVVKVLENYIDDHPIYDKKILDNVFVSGEFGGVVSVHLNGERKESVNQEFAIPLGLRSLLEIKAEEFSDYVFVDHEKQTQFTLEATFNKNVNLMDDHGDEIASALGPLIQDLPELEAHVDRLAVNIKNKKANKSYSTQQFLNWLKDKAITPQKIYVFGDSPSDIEMGAKLTEQNLPFEFIFAGEENEIDKSSISFPLTITKGHCDEGTLEYLNSLNP